MNDQETAAPEIEPVESQDPINHIDDNEALRLTEEAVEILRDYNRPIIFELDIKHTVGLIGMLQLAFRHPATTNSPTAMMLRRWTFGMIRALDPTKGTVFRYLCLGFNPRFDNLDERVAGVTVADTELAKVIARAVLITFDPSYSDEKIDAAPNLIDGIAEQLFEHRTGRPAE